MKKRRKRAGVNSLVRLDVAARKAGIPFLEYNCMPVGELSDFLDFFAESEGGCYTVKTQNQDYILDVR